MSRGDNFFVEKPEICHLADGNTIYSCGNKSIFNLEILLYGTIFRTVFQFKTKTKNLGNFDCEC